MRRVHNALVEVAIYVEPAHETKPELKALDQYADENGEVELMFECTVAPYRPAYVSGPPENCYPAEGGDVEDITTSVQGKDGKSVVLPDKWADQLIEHFRARIDEGAFEAAMEPPDEPEYERDDDM